MHDGDCKSPFPIHDSLYTKAVYAVLCRAGQAVRHRSSCRSLSEIRAQSTSTFSISRNSFRNSPNPEEGRVPSWMPEAGRDTGTQRKSANKIAKKKNVTLTPYDFFCHRI